ncbi:crAss001_48 related protein [Parvimonas sp. G1641]|uniref:crAss001_48 related protein n=1 Tax=Parvimonas sp. G1641 TaxID=3388846 RepID=UPI00397FED26
MKLDFLDRMYEEYNSLDTKIIKLEKALKTKELDRREKELLISQKQHMKAYREDLNKRINYTKEKYSNL